MSRRLVALIAMTVACLPCMATVRDRVLWNRGPLKAQRPAVSERREIVSNQLNKGRKLLATSSSSISNADRMGCVYSWVNNPEVAIRLLMLLFYSTLGCVMPFMPVYYRKLGFSG
jgi:hypothetical protein